MKNNPVHEYIREETGYQKAIVYMELGVDKKRQFKTVWGKKKDELYYKNVSAYRYSSNGIIIDERNSLRVKIYRIILVKYYRKFIQTLAR